MLFAARLSKSILPNGSPLAWSNDGFQLNRLGTESSMSTATTSITAISKTKILLLFIATSSFPAGILGVQRTPPCLHFAHAVLAGIVFPVSHLNE